MAKLTLSVDALIASGRLNQASDLVGSMVANPAVPVEEAARLKLTLASILLVTGRPAESRSNAESIIASRNIGHEFNDFAAWLSFVAILSEGDVRRARQAAESVLAGGRRPSMEGALTGALSALSFVAWQDGRLADSVGLLRAAVRRSDRGTQKCRQLSTRLRLARFLATVGDFDQAAGLISSVQREIEPSDAPLWSPALPIVRGLCHFAAGRRGQAAADARAGLALSQRLGTRAFLPLCDWILAGKAIDDGNLTQAGQHVARYQAELPAIEGPMGAANYGLTEACLTEARDGPGAALELVYALTDDAGALKRLLLMEPTAAAFMVRTATAAGDGREARTVVEAAELLAIGNPDFSVLGAAAAQARGLFDQDRSQLERAVADHRHPWAQASATEDLATLLADSNPAAARMYYEQAAAGYGAVGAKRDVARVCARRRAVRITRQRRSRYDLPPSGWGSLTSREIHVTRLVAQGLSNPQVAETLFLSRHTVDFHLRQIFRKLTISSRVELARIYVDHEGGGNDHPPKEMP